MEHFEFRYTVGMDDAEVSDYLRNHRVGVLSMADGGRAYAVPVNYYYDGDSLYVRLIDDEDSTKMDYLRATEEVCLLVYGVAGDVSWSIQARGPVRKLTGSEREAFDDRRINEEFGPVRIFGEQTAEIDLAVYELEAPVITGRRTAER